MTSRRAWLVLVLGALFGFLWGLLGFHYVHAHEHQKGETEEQKRVVDFMRSWMRPKGPYAVQHRMSSCCYFTGLNQDCYPVKEARIRGGLTEVIPDIPGDDSNHWYTVPAGVSEIEQPDPRESPDGRSYVCIAGNNVICYVPGAGN